MASAALVVLTTLSSRLVLAQAVDDGTRNAARSLAEQGRELFEQGKHEQATDLFHRAYALVPAPTIALYEARSLIKLGRLVEAEEAYLRAVHTRLKADATQQFRKAVSEAEAEVEELRPRIPKVTIVIVGAAAQSPELTVTIDNRPVTGALLGVPMPINPGEHQLAASVPRGEPARIVFSIRETEQKSVQLQVSLPASAAPDPSGPAAPQPRREVTTPPEPGRATWHKPAAFAAGGVGLAGVATGVIAGMMSSSRYSTAEEECPDHVCTPGSAGEDAVESFRSLRTVSTVGYIVGGVGLAAGVTLFVLAPSKTKDGAGNIGFFLSPQTVGMRGAF